MFSLTLNNKRKKTNRTKKIYFLFTPLLASPLLPPPSPHSFPYLFPSLLSPSPSPSPLPISATLVNTIEVTDPDGMWINLIYILLIHLYLDIEINLDELQGASKIIGRFYLWRQWVVLEVFEGGIACGNVVGNVYNWGDVTTAEPPALRQGGSVFLYFSNENSSSDALSFQAAG